MVIILDLELPSIMLNSFFFISQLIFYFYIISTLSIFNSRQKLLTIYIQVQQWLVYAGG